MRTLRDAQSAAKSLGHAIGGQQQGYADTIADAFGALADRLTAIEDILRTLAQKAAISADEAVKTATDRQTAAQSRVGTVVQARAVPSHVETEIRRILG
jgi:hypothetical protein